MFKLAAATGWFILMIASCQLVDNVEPEVEFRQPVVGEAFYHPFTLEMEVDGPKCKVDFLATDKPDDLPGEVSCIGPVTVSGFGWGAVDEGPYAARTEFEFDPLTCACGGQISILYENPNYTYEFEIVGHGEMEGNIVSSEEIMFPLELRKCTGPYDNNEVFVGNLILQRPKLIAEGQEGTVSINARIEGRFFAFGYPVATE